MEKIEDFKNLEKTYCVYLLSCKNTPNIIYIGITNKYYAIERLFFHFCESTSRTSSKNNEKHDWILDNWRNIEMKILDYNISDEQSARILEAQYVFKYRKEKFNVLNKTYVAVRCYDNNGDFYKDYASYAEAAKEFQVMPSRIMQCAEESSSNIRLFKKYRFFKWYPGIPEKIDSKQYNDNYIKTPVLQYSNEGNFIKEWKNRKEIEQELKLTTNQLSYCLKDFSRTSNGFHFIYKTSDKIEPFILPKKIKVIAYKNETELGKFTSIKDCAKFLINELKIAKGTEINVAGSISKSFSKNKSYLGLNFKIF